MAKKYFQNGLTGLDYYDPQIFKQEISQIFAKNWMFAGHQSRLVKAGDYFTFTICDQDLFCIKDKMGDIRCFYNVCQHRGHPLLQGDGNVANIRCPYHAWCYDLKGEFVKAPALTLEKQEKGQFRLSEVKLEIFIGFIFVNLDENAKPMQELYGEALKEIEAHLPHWQDLKPMEWVKLEEKCNWKVAIENYSECYHCRFNHKNFACGVIKPDPYNVEISDYSLKHATVTQNLDHLHYDIDPNMPHSGDYGAWYLWPLFSFQSYPGNRLNVFHWRPIDAEHTVLYRGWFTPDGKEDEATRVLMERDQNTLQEDLVLIEAIQRGMKSHGFKQARLMIDDDGGLNSEHSIAQIHKWVKESRF